MQNSALRKQLETLQAEFERLPADAAARPRLAQLIAAIERRLDHTDDALQRTQLLENLSDSIRRFEVQHPSLTASLSEVLNSLSTMGI
ncbi:MAG: hypothetical protein JWR16_2433 [Nevskia sp.]|nr:hypothetical protein [Nevskia sp.]